MFNTTRLCVYRRGVWGVGLFSYLLQHNTRKTSLFLVLLALIQSCAVTQRALPPSTIKSCSFCPHLMLCLTATKNIVSLSTSITSLRLITRFCLCPFFVLYHLDAVIRSLATLPPPPLFFPTSLSPPLFPFHYFIYFLSVHLAGLSQEMAACPRFGIKALLVSWLTL